MKSNKETMVQLLKEAKQLQKDFLAGPELQYFDDEETPDLEGVRELHENFDAFADKLISYLTGKVQEVIIAELTREVKWYKMENLKLLKETRNAK